MNAQQECFSNKLLVVVLGFGLVLAAAPGLPTDAAVQSAQATGSHLSAAESSASGLRAAIEHSFLDRWLLLRGDIQVATSRQIQEEPRPLLLDEAGGGEPVANPATIVTAQGIFYHTNSSVLPSDRPLAPVGSLHPAFDVHDRAVEPFADRVRKGRSPPEIVVALRSGEITRLIQISVSPRGILVQVDSVETRDVWVLFRMEVRSTSGENAQLASFASLAERLFYLSPAEGESAALEMDPAWPAEIRTAILKSQVVDGMTTRQVLLSFGAPIHVTRRAGDSRQIWLFKRGRSIREQLRNTTNVVFSDGHVVTVEDATPWRSGNPLLTDSDS